MPNLKSRLKPLTVVGAVLLLTAACGSSGTTGSETTVNALWYGKQKDGSIAQGVTKVTVETQDSNQSGFKVDLSGFESANAGAYWNSAAWSAAAVATLSSASDPRNLTVKFGVQEKIDGPSAGGLLAVGIRADLASGSVASNKTMTGTILPNGAIGPVGGIPAKLRAAKDAGLTTVLIPKGQTISTDPASGEKVNVVEQGRTLGIDVQETASVVEATDVLTGAAQKSAQADAGPIGAGLLTVVSKAATAALADAKKTPLATSPIPSLARMRPAVVKQVSSFSVRAQAALNADDAVKALTNASAAARLSYAWNARVATVTKATKSGVSAAAQDLQTTGEQLAREIESQITQASQTPTQYQEQVVGLADALSWGTDALARTSAVNTRVKNAGTDQSPEVLGAEGADLAESRYNADFMLKTAIAALATVGKVAINGADNTAAFLNSYSEFLAEAAEANGRYFEEIAKASGDQASDAGVKQDLEVIAAGRARWDEVKAASSGPELAVKLSQAISRYIDSTVVIASYGAVAAASDGGATSRIDILDSEALRSQQVVAGATTALEARIMAAGGLDSSYTRWSDQWGAGLTAAAAAEASADQVELEGLIYQWFANMQAAITVALNKATK